VNAPVADQRRRPLGGMGLRSMRERAAEAGLLLEIVSAPDQGTHPRCDARIPATGSSPERSVTQPGHVGQVYVPVPIASVGPCI
jgi:signal transduction histidine kinase